MKLLSRPQIDPKNGCFQKITPESAGWKYVGFEAYQLQPGMPLTQETGGNEVCLVFLSGTASVQTNDAQFDDVGERQSVFDENINAHAVYVPANSQFSIFPKTVLEVAVCKAPATGKLSSRHIKPSDVNKTTRGKGTNERFIRDILPDTAEAESLLVVEVITPGGHWSSYPSHKHDRDALPEESFLEETYFHKFEKPQGFGFQRVYTDDGSLDEAMTIRDNDVVMVPRGYHPVAAAHGYNLYYLNVMAGPTRQWVFQTAPEHQWLMK